MDRKVIREYAAANGVRLRENESALFIDVPKGDLVFKLTVLKGNEILEWFIDLKEVATGSEVYSTNFEYYPVDGESHEQLIQEMEEEVVEFIRVVQTRAVRVAKQPLFRLFGKSFGSHEQLEFKATTGWHDWASLRSTSSA